ncbi:MAG: AMP-binding protein, partial [Emcibacter sp.]|nr:AMP-binding protein [Emcibacter sp.]
MMSAYEDSFAAAQMPQKDALPDFIHDLPCLDYPDRLNAAVELLDKNIAAGRGDKTAILTPTESWTYQDVFEKSNQIAHILVKDMGLKSGNRVLLRAANNPMMVACWFAVLKAGGIAVATMPLLRAMIKMPGQSPMTTEAMMTRLLVRFLQMFRHATFLIIVCFFCHAGRHYPFMARMES